MRVKNSKEKLYKHPMSIFYTYKDEVPSGARVSTPKDCEICRDEDCKVRQCLITE